MNISRFISAHVNIKLDKNRKDIVGREDVAEMEIAGLGKGVRREERHVSAIPPML